MTHRGTRAFGGILGAGLAAIALATPLRAVIPSASAEEAEYPRILIHNFQERPPMPRKQIEALARRDLVILSPIFRHDYADIAAIRKLNPKVTVLQYALTFQVAVDDRAQLSNDDEAALFAPHAEAWLSTAPVAVLERAVEPQETSLVLSAPLAKPRARGFLPLLLCGSELMRVTALEGTRVTVLRGGCGTAAGAHAAGTPVARVTQPPSWTTWYRAVTDRSEVLNINLSDRAPAIGGRQPWQIKADYLAESWGNAEWRQAFDGFFLDEGQAQVAPQGIDLDRNGQPDEPSEIYASMQRGERLLTQRLRARCGSKAILVFNNTGEIIPGASGRHREHFADVRLGRSAASGSWLAPMGNWAYSIEPMRAWTELGHAPAYVLNSSQPGTWDDYRQVRFGLASAVLFGSYFQYRAQSGDRANWQHWFDEFAVDAEGKPSSAAGDRHWLGRPLGPARQIVGPLATVNQAADAAWRIAVAPSQSAAARLDREGATVRVKIERLRVPRAETVLIHAPAAGKLKPGSEYTLTLRSRASSGRLIDFRVVDARGSALGGRVEIPIYVKPEWQHHVFTCQTGGADAIAPFQLSFAVGREEGEVELRDITWQEGAAEQGWVREFERGVVAVNPTSQAQRLAVPAGLRKLRGIQDARHNDGQPVGDALEIPPLDAYLLQRVR